MSEQITAQEILRRARRLIEAGEFKLADAIALAVMGDPCPPSVEDGAVLAERAMRLLYDYLRFGSGARIAATLERWESARSRSDVLLALARAAEDRDAVRELEAAYDAEMARTEQTLRAAVERIGGGRDEH
jgi:hypothetical protein